MAIFTKKKLIGFLMDLVLWTIVAMKKLPDTEKTSNRPQKKVLPILFTTGFKQFSVTCVPFTVALTFADILGTVGSVSSSASCSLTLEATYSFTTKNSTKFTLNLYFNCSMQNSNFCTSTTIFTIVTKIGDREK